MDPFPILGETVPAAASTDPPLTAPQLSRTVSLIGDPAARGLPLLVPSLMLEASSAEAPVSLLPNQEPTRRRAGRWVADSRHQPVMSMGAGQEDSAPGEMDHREKFLQMKETGAVQLVQGKSFREAAVVDHP